MTASTPTLKKQKTHQRLKRRRRKYSDLADIIILCIMVKDKKEHAKKEKNKEKRQNELKIDGFFCRYLTLKMI
jgi:hypothetical protein